MTYLVTVRVKRRTTEEPAEGIGDFVSQHIVTEDMLAEGVVLGFTQFATGSMAKVEDYEIHIVPR